MRKRTLRQNIAAFLAASGALLAPVLAFAWTQEATFGAHVHGHEFARATLTGDGCSLKVRVFFDAPEEAYKNERAWRNYYRFHARIKLDTEHVVLTRVFNNDSPGARVYDYVQDTSAEGCWAKTESKVRGVDVEGCRGRGCTPEPFK
jgi:hypothetical protein